MVAALRSGRHSYGIELNPAYAEIARQVVSEERSLLNGEASKLAAEVIQGDAANIARIAADHELPVVDYVLTSPPYWDMLHAQGAQTQKNRRASQDMDVFYSDDPADLGNVSDYDEFLARLAAIYIGLKPLIKRGGYLTIIVKNVKKGGKMYPLAWDLASRLGQFYTLKDERIWCQDNQRLAPYGLGSAWVSNTFHHYCLQFRNEENSG